MAELKVANANLENTVENLRRELDESRQHLKRAQQEAAENAHIGGADGVDHGLDDHASGGDNVPLSVAQDEIRKVQTHYENEVVLAKQERVELSSKI